MSSWCWLLPPGLRFCRRAPNLEPGLLPLPLPLLLLVVVACRPPSSSSSE
jgi:hypothetical protein